MKHTWTISIFLLVLFFGAQLIGLAILNSYIDLQASAEKNKIVLKPCPIIDCPTSEESPPPISWLTIIGAVIAGTVLILLIIKFANPLVWKIWFYLAMVLCLTLALTAFINFVYALLISLLVGWFKVFKPNIIIHNLSELFIYGGLARMFAPILDVTYAFLLLIALSFYDMYAVWKSKHMVTMAKFQTESGVFAGLMIPYGLPSGKGVKRPGRTAVLGGGDIGFPLILAGTVFLEHGFYQALAISVGASAALFILLMLSQKDKFYPAMPFLTMGCALGYLATLLL